jgi:hypothetical protein
MPYAEFHYAESHYAEFHYAEFHYAEFHHAECHKSALNEECHYGDSCVLIAVMQNDRVSLC